MCADDTAQPVEILVEERDGVVVVALAGELDLAGAPVVSAALDEALRAARHGVALDLSRLEYMDSTGLRTLLDAGGRAVARGRRMAVLRGAGPAHRVIALVGAAAVLEHVDHPDDLRGAPPGPAGRPSA